MTVGATGNEVVLIVDDEAELTEALTTYFRKHQLDAQVANDLPSARDLLRQLHFDAVLLDLNVGREDGMVLARELAIAGRPPFVIMSGRTDEVDRVVGIEIGAHDYIVKPFSYRELLARVQGVIRHSLEPRRGMARRRLAHFAGWTVDLSAFTAQHSSGKHIELTAGELGILRALLSHPHRVLPRHELLAMTRHDDGAVFSRTVDVLVTRLRKKIEIDPARPALIRTVRGEGYRLDEDVTWEQIPV